MKQPRKGRLFYYQSKSYSINPNAFSNAVSHFVGRVTSIQKDRKHKFLIYFDYIYKYPDNTTSFAYLTLQEYKWTKRVTQKIKIEVI